MRLAVEEEDVRVDRILRRVDVRDEVLDPTVVLELRSLPACTLVDEPDLQAAREERRLAQALHERLSGELEPLEDLRVGEKRVRRPRLLRDADRLHLSDGLAAREFLPIDLAVAL